MHRRLTRAAMLSVGAAILSATLASCGGSSSASPPTVTGHAFGAVTPKVSFPSSTAPGTLSSTVLTQGTGATVKKGDLLIANYVGQVWNGKIFDSSFKRHQLADFQIGVGKVIPGWDKTLVGTKVGSRLLLVIPPKDGYGASGQPQAGIPANATLVFVVDIVATFPENAGLPSSAGTLKTTSGAYRLDWPATTPPQLTLVGKPTLPKHPGLVVVSKGHGPKVTTGLLILELSEYNLKTGVLLGSSWQQKVPAGIAVTSPKQNVVKLFYGVPVGSRVLLLIPGAGSNPPSVYEIDVVAEPHDPQA